MDIKSLTLKEMEDEFNKLGEPKYRAKQVYRWLHKGIQSFDEITDISKKLRERLSSKYFITNALIENKLVSECDDTKKYLLKFSDGEFVESVLMRYNHGYSICISTQAGCKMGCSFCATGKGGFRRNLTASEMISEIQTVERDLGSRISNVVLMGMGEPLDNYENVLKFLHLVSSEDGLNIGIRHISLSTCGLVDKIYDLANEKLGITLSISLHAPSDELRSRIMKINKKFPLHELIKACDFYTSSTGRRISYEYAMINGVNDSDECASQLANLLRGKLCHLNLIPVNNINESNFEKSSRSRLNKFKSILEKNKINVTVRRTLGSDIEASCGQLRGKKIKEEEGLFEGI